MEVTCRPVTINDADDGQSENTGVTLLPQHLQHARSATLALHADESLELENDIAPSIHVSTTFRYPKNPDELKPFYDREIGVSQVHRI